MSMNINKARVARAVSLAVPLGFLALRFAAKAVDPTLADVSALFAAWVTAILSFAMAVIAAFVGAALIPQGLKKLGRYAAKLLGRA